MKGLSCCNLLRMKPAPKRPASIKFSRAGDYIVKIHDLSRLLGQQITPPPTPLPVHQLHPSRGLVSLKIQIKIQILPFEAFANFSIGCFELCLYVCEDVKLNKLKILTIEVQYTIYVM